MRKYRALDKFGGRIIKTQINLVQLTIARRIDIALYKRGITSSLLDSTLYAFQAVGSAIWVNSCTFEALQKVHLILEVECRRKVVVLI